MKVVLYLKDDMCDEDKELLMDNLLVLIETLEGYRDNGPKRYYLNCNDMIIRRLKSGAWSIRIVKQEEKNEEDV